MAKLNKSHAENSRMLDPKVLPFFEDWKNNLQNSSRNTNKNIEETPLKTAVALDFQGNYGIIDDNEFVPKEVPSYYLCEEYTELCNKYHIPYKKVYHSYSELDATEELVAEYADLLKDAKSLGIYWDISTFDIEGLREAVDEARNEYYSEEAEQEYFAEARSNRWVYYSGLGVL